MKKPTHLMPWILRNFGIALLGLFIFLQSFMLVSAKEINLKSIDSDLEGQYYPGSYRSSSGIFYDSLLSAAGFDSIIVRNLTLETPPPALEAEYVSICEGDSVPDLIAVGENIQWYDDEELSNLIYSGDTLKTGQTLAGTYQYYVTQTIAGLSSSAVMVTLSIDRIPPSPIVNDTVCCEGEYIDYLIAESHYDFIRWYSDPELTNVLIYSDILNISDISEPGTYNFYVTSTLECESLPDTVSYTINPSPQLPLAEDVAICENESVALLVAKGENITWYGETDSNLFDPRDRQHYKGVEIGDQVWMAENLNYYTPKGTSWYYDNDSLTYAEVYGRLYDREKAFGCPSGWHLPSDAEWYEMFNFLGGDSIAAGKLKEQGNSHWLAPNSDATNISGFTALPAGYSINLDFFSFGEEAYFWSSQSGGKEMGIAFRLSYNSPEITKEKLYMDGDGASVRCIKDSIHDFYDIIEFGDTLVVPVTQAGTYPFYVTQTISNCTSPFDTVRLSINPIPATPLVDNVTVCEGEEIPDLLATGENIQWYTDSELNSWLYSGNSLSTGQTQAGEYTYFLNQSVAGCESLADSVSLRIHSLPRIDLGNDTTIFTDQILNLNIGNPEYSYIWSDGSNLPYCKLSGVELGLGEHIYWVVASDANACLNADSIGITVIEPVNLPFKNARNSVKIYPNPVKDLMFVQTRIPGKHKIEITSINGGIIYSRDFFGTYMQIDFSSFQEGIYIIRIESKDTVTTEEIIKY